MMSSLSRDNTLNVLSVFRLSYSAPKEGMRMAIKISDMIENAILTREVNAIFFRGFALYV